MISLLIPHFLRQLLAWYFLLPSGILRSLTGTLGLGVIGPCSVMCLNPTLWQTDMHL